MTAEQSTRLAFARVLDGHRTALVRYLREQAGRDLYAVGSATDLDVAYLVTVSRDPEQFACDCPAKKHVACWHRAAVFAARAGRQAARLPKAGPTLTQLRYRDELAARRQTRSRYTDAELAAGLALAGELAG